MFCHLCQQTVKCQGCDKIGVERKAAPEDLKSTRRGRGRPRYHARRAGPAGGSETALSKAERIWSKS